MTYRLSAALLTLGALAAAQSALAQSPPTVHRGSICYMPGLAPLGEVAPAIDAMTTSEIQTAMAFGRSSAKLSAYQLRARRSTALFGGRARAVLLTPFLRVAAATQYAAATSQPFIETGIHSCVMEELVWIVGFPAELYRYSSGDPDSPLYLASVTGIVIRPAASRTAKDLIQPVWTLHLNPWDPTIFQGVLRLNRRVMVAAFPMTALQAGNTILFTYSSTAPTSEGRGPDLVVPKEVRRVSIRPTDVRKWR